MAPKQIGPYSIINVLGRGGMGTVYHGVLDDTGEQVALKLLAANYADDDHFRTRFAAEIETLQKLDHVNIVRLISYGQEEGQLFFAMELVEGKSLHDVQKTGRSFEWLEVVDITRQICAGLRHAHDRGVIHRDLKPGNLLLTEHGIVKLTDFGIAKLFGGRHITAVGGVVGTADFMAPEQLAGKTASIRTDMYSLGAVMYTLLARRPPFMFKNVSEASRVLERERPTRLGTIVQGCPVELEKIIHQLLERNPDARIGTPQALIKRLEHFLDELKNNPPTAESGEDIHESFDIIEGPVHHRETFDLGVEVFNQPTTPADSQSSHEPEEESDSDELKLEAEEPLSDSITRRNTSFSVSPASRADYFTKVESDLAEPAQASESVASERGPIWPYAFGLVAVLGIIGFGIWMTIATRPDANDLYDEIVRIMEESDEPTDAREPIEQFLKRFPQDDRVNEVERYELELQADRFPRRLETRARLRGVHELLPMEQEFLAAMEISDLDPIRSRDRFQAIVDLYQDSADEKAEQQCIIAARTQIELLDRIIAEDIAERRDEIYAALRRAETQRANNPERLTEICTAIITLYSDRDWADDLVEAARMLMEEPID